MKYAVTILICLALVSTLPELAAMGHSTVGPRALTLSQTFSSGSEWLFRIVSSTPQPVWLVAIGMALILLSWFVRRRLSRSVSQSSR